MLQHLSPHYYRRNIDKKERKDKLGRIKKE